MEPRDPYCNYGPHSFWLDVEVNLMTVWKIIYDRAGNDWKTMWYTWQAYKKAHDAFRMIVVSSMQCVADRRNHATAIGFPERDRV